MQENGLVLVDENQFIYPSIKDDTVEYQVELVKNDILEKITEGTVFFSTNFRLSNIVINSIAKKYWDFTYPAEDEEEERFLLGAQQMRKELKEIDCKYLQKVNDCIDKNKDIKRTELVAVYLLDVDDSDENRQKFLILTKKKLFLRYATNKIEAYSYNKIVQKENAFELKSGETLLEYEFDDRFNGFVDEFFRLLRVDVGEIGERHPFADNDYELKKNYIDFLVDTAAAEGYLTADNLMRIEYMAKEFNVSDVDLTKLLEKAYKGGIRENKLSANLSGFITKLDTEYIDTFYLDLLEVAAGSGSGKRLRAKLLKILSKEDYAGEKFVENYCQYVESRKQAEVKLKQAMELIYKLKKNHRLEDDLENAFTMLNYSEAMNLQFLKMEVM